MNIIMLRQQADKSHTKRRRRQIARSMPSVGRARSFATAIIVLLAIGGHLFMLSVRLTESRTVLWPTDGSDGGSDDEETHWEEDSLEHDEDSTGLRRVGLKQTPARLAAILHELAATTSRTNDDDDGPRAMMRWGASLGLRRIQRQPEYVLGRRLAPASSSASKRAARFKAANTKLLQSQQNESIIDHHQARPAQTYWSKPNAAENFVTTQQQKRSLEWQRELKPARKNSNGLGHKFIYVISPISELVHPFQAERFAQGYKNLLPLSGNYEIGLQKLSDAKSIAGVDLGPITSPLKSLEEAAGIGSAALGCHATRALVQLVRDERDPISDRLVRQCTGSAELNTCEGSCPSGVQPSIKSPTGFVKRCTCCNEGSFRRVRVRLDQCTMAPPANSGHDSQQQELVVGTPGSGVQNSFMQIEVEEPIDCECRQCDSLI